MYSSACVCSSSGTQIACVSGSKWLVKCVYNSNSMHFGSSSTRVTLTSSTRVTLTSSNWCVYFPDVSLTGVVCRYRGCIAE